MITWLLYDVYIYQTFPRLITLMQIIFIFVTLIVKIQNPTKIQEDCQWKDSLKKGNQMPPRDSLNGIRERNISRMRAIVQILLDDISNLNY